MNELRCTLNADGVSDRALIPVLAWLVRQHLPHYAVQWEFADLQRVPIKNRTLPIRIEQSLRLYPCDLLFIHRDAENVPHAMRVAEIIEAIATTPVNVPPAVCVVSVRMQEAWLLFDEDAIRKATGNPNGRQPLDIPRVMDLESILDPKNLLHALLRNASGLGAHRRKKFQPQHLTHRVAELISDFSPLRVLPAFNALEADLVRILNEQGWNAV